MKTNRFTEIRRQCRTVARRSKYVKIAEDRLVEYALSLPLETLQKPELDTKTHFIGTPPETAAFFLTLDAVNFGSGYFPHLKKRSGKSGYFTIAAALTDYFRQYGVIPPEKSAKLTAEDCAEIFGQDIRVAPVYELMTHFAVALNDLGSFLIARFDGDVLKLIHSAESSAANLVEILIQMPYFNDVEDYEEIRVPFFKRAQLTAADLNVALNGQGPGYFTDLTELTIFADNLVPHVLRIDGVLAYQEALAERIDTQEPIPSGSIEEIEIRACALHSVEMMVDIFRNKGKAVTAMQLDYLLWNRGQNPFYKKIKPRHRTRTVFY